MEATKLCKKNPSPYPICKVTPNQSQAYFTFFFFKYWNNYLLIYHIMCTSPELLITNRILVLCLFWGLCMQHQCFSHNEAVQDERWNVVPFLSDAGLFSLFNFPGLLLPDLYYDAPNVFCWLKVWTAGRPVQHQDSSPMNPCCCDGCSIWFSIVLL